MKIFMKEGRSIQKTPSSKIEIFSMTIFALNQTWERAFTESL